jgi:hypothetical protein
MKATAESYDPHTGELYPLDGGNGSEATAVKWCHIACAIYVPFLWFAKSERLEGIAGAVTIPRAFAALTCTLCGKKGQGVCIQVCMR